MTFEVTDRLDLGACAGPRRPTDRRPAHPDRVVLHRNTASQYHLDRNPHLSDMSHVELLHAFHSAGPYSFRLFPYHYFIDLDGTTYRIHDEMTITPHAPNRGNRRSIGVAFNIDGRKKPLNPDMEGSAVALLRDIMSRWPDIRVMGHSEKKQCPGPYIKPLELEEQAKGKKEQA